MRTTTSRRATVLALVLTAACVAPAAAVAAPAPVPAAVDVLAVPGPDPHTSTIDDSVLRVRRAWQASTGAGVTVAVLGTGVDATHPDLAGALLPGYDAVDGDSTVVEDTDGSGTGVAGVVAARSNGTGVLGLAFASSVLPVRVTSGDAAATDARVVEGLRWAVSHGARVVHVAHAVPHADPALRTAVADALAAGVVVVAPAGDTSSGAPRYPAAWASELPGLVAVSATTNDLTAAPSASWGEWVTVAAPGEDVPTTRPGNGYVFRDGSVYAAARVAGVVALVRAHEPALTPAEVATRLRTTAQDTGPRGADPFYGNGIVDAAAAVTLRDAVPAAPGLPFDRLPGDGGEDDLLAGATPVARDRTGSADLVGDLDSEGDVDWYSFEAVADARYQLWVAGPVTVDVCDTAGRPLLTADGFSTLHPFKRIDGTGPWLLRVRRAPGSTSTHTDYSVRLTLADDQPRTSLRFDRGTLVSPPTTDATNDQLTLADVTGDGVTDAVTWSHETAAAPAPAGSTVPVLRYHPGRPDGTFDAHRTVRLGGPVDSWPRVVVAAAELDGDPAVELVATNETDVWVVDLGGAEPVVRSEASRAGWYPEAHLVADVDTDGDQDLVGWEVGGVLLLRNDGQGRLTPTTYPLPDARPAAVVDVDSDARPDVVLAGGRVLHQRADGGFEEGAPLAWLVDAAGVAVGDLTGDGRADLVASTGAQLLLRAGTATGWADDVTVLDERDVGSELRLADVDGDGRTDVVGHTPFETSVSLQQRDGSFLTDRFSLGGPDWVMWANPVLLDADGSGRPGLLFSAPGRGLVLARQGETAPGPTPWVTDVSPVTSARGVGVRPTVTVTLGEDVDLGTVSAATVRLLDGVTREPVAVQRIVQPGGVVRLVPTADLVAGRSYQVAAQGLRTTTGVAQDERAWSWFTVAAGGDRFTPLEPTRVFDSREEDGPLTPAEPVVLGFGDLLPPDATAVVLNVTASNPSAPGNVRAYPVTQSGEPPHVSNLNVVPGIDQPASVTVRLGLDQAVELLTAATTTNLVVDLAGYYAPEGATAYTSSAPVRVLDTRTGVGGLPREPVRSGRWVELQVAGVNGVPADAAAVVLNVTGTQVAGRTHVRVYPAPAASEDQTPLFVSNLNLEPGRDQANLVTVRVGDGGRIRLFTYSADVHLVADLAGWYSPTGELGFVPLEPERIADSRTGLGVARRLRAGQPVELAVAGTAGVPGTAVAAALTVTASNPAGPTHVRAFPVTSPATLPDISTLNLVPRRDEANATIARLGVGGRVGLYTHSADTDLVVDVSGYFTR
ncbi:S8 family serine peptidase [Cellulomonas cellasea]|uniref:Peptidase S8/S53 domain-containing protein n=1 Tax=Cellulomonas cellasea TaxID=43670 RepID=A0A7W4UGZ9_9CELL|nr:S8 family serine peptidase [Cellulomonas cellasea]MBB2923644.1 hypothetical protein [Cellulomonas cellasea]